jgi:hypothetical protein
MTNQLKFYFELEAKTCSHCGNSFDEQCESYHSCCPDCSWTPTGTKGQILHVGDKGWDWK